MAAPKWEAVLLDPAGEMRPAPAPADPQRELSDAFMRQLLTLIADIRAGQPAAVHTLGIGLPGAIDPQKRTH